MVKLCPRRFGISCVCIALTLSCCAVDVRGPYYCSWVEMVAAILPAHAEGVAAKQECCESARSFFMRRTWRAAVCVLLIVLLAPVVRAGEKRADAPTVVVRVKSINALLQNLNLV